jgi:hypothetical protein
MAVLVYGPGVIGTLNAARSQEAGHQVLARTSVALATALDLGGLSRIYRRLPSALQFVGQYEAFTKLYVWAECISCIAPCDEWH